MTYFRHFLSIILLPFTVVVAIPYTLLKFCAGAAEHRAWDWLFQIGGGLLFALGFCLFAWCVLLFARVGRGTLAPWDPTRALVAVGPYRHVRNPMISAVAVMLVAEALLTRSGLIFGWAGVFVLINHLYFILMEEPGLERRFGEAYLGYKRKVPRWIPRVW